MKPVAWTTMPDADDWEFISGDKDPNNHLDGVWHSLYTANQLRQAKMEVLREAANECEGMFQEYNCDGTERNMSYVCAERLRHMADELEKQK